ncbi:uridine diphosphate-N-acetylglucosamine-binding protein YvcK [Candidatus Auribacterota bacterium]
MNKKRVVSIGGGTGQSIVLSALKEYKDIALSAIIAVTDSGRNSGFLRKELKIIPPGDLRNCLAALSEEKSLLKDIFQYRFEEGKCLKGMSLGNLFIAGAAGIKGGMEEGLDAVAKLLKVKGDILPASFESLDLCAELESGKTVCGEAQVRKIKKEKIKKLFLKQKKAKANPKAITAIRKADFIIIGPGSLYTSIITNFLLKEIKKAILFSPAKKIVIMNLLSQPGQTDRLSGEKHLEELITYMGKNVINYLIMNNKKINKKTISYYQNQGAEILKISLDEIKKRGIIPLFTPLVKDCSPLRKKEWEKHNLLKHDVKKISNVLYELIINNR